MAEIGHNGGPMDEGWIARHRSVRDHWLVGHGIQVKPADEARKRCHTQGEAWEDLLMECRYADGTVNNGGHKMELRRGELIGAVSWLANRWNWTPKTVRRFLDQLENDHMIELKKPGSENGTQKGKQATVVSVCNYDNYQSYGEAKGQAKGQPEGKQRASRGQAEGNIYKDNKGTKEQEDTPPPPKGGEGSGEMFAGREPEPPKADRDRRDVAAAFEVYGKAAEHFGLAKCQAITAARSRRMAKRLADIGGVENFKAALRALGSTSDPLVKFLRGKAPTRNGESPFRLDIDRLLQTDGNLGDVLARLLDTAAAAHSAQQDATPAWAVWSPEEWDRQIDANANGIWPWAKLGPPPGSKGCACPPDIVVRRRLTELYDQNGISRGKH
jgi:hypothetical protein